MIKKNIYQLQRGLHINVHVSQIKKYDKYELVQKFKEFTIPQRKRLVHKSKIAIFKKTTPVLTQNTCKWHIGW